MANIFNLALISKGRWISVNVRPTRAMLSLIVIKSELGNGARLQAQHSGGRGRWTSDFEVSLVYRVS